MSSVAINWSPQEAANVFLTTGSFEAVQNYFLTRGVSADTVPGYFDAYRNCLFQRVLGAFKEEDSFEGFTKPDASGNHDILREVKFRISPSELTRRIS
ncbi:hypothetical protein KA107_03065 [Candidatus Pacearchaeota archaeon]|nr:hypothetical protein [Candidatus Pacearchaeota archaeon]